jgi:hypothetical protein
MIPCPPLVRYLPVWCVQPETCLFVRTGEEVGWAPVLNDVADVDGILEAHEGAASLVRHPAKPRTALTSFAFAECRHPTNQPCCSQVCASPPLDPDAPRLMNDDCDDGLMEGSTCVGQCIRLCLSVSTLTSSMSIFSSRLAFTRCGDPLRGGGAGPGGAAAAASGLELGRALSPGQ